MGRVRKGWGGEGGMGRVRVESGSGEGEGGMGRVREGAGRVREGWGG